jgi:hypothetical protein
MTNPPIGADVVRVCSDFEIRSRRQVRRLHADPADLPIAERRPALAGAALRWLRCHVRAEARARRNDGAYGDVCDDYASAAVRRAVRIRIRFHRAVDRLVVAGGFDEASSILSERYRELAHIEAEARERSSQR